jgi:hypothetical protein
MMGPMRGDLLRFWPGLCVVVLLGACSNILGISSYEIDPNLGQDPSPEAGGSDTGGTAGSGATSGSGGGAAGESQGGQVGEAGAAGAPNPPVECKTDVECDDGFDCTTDGCTVAGKCNHLPKDSLCDAMQCETCVVGIGCVAGAKQTTQLLLDPNFDDMNADWSEKSDTFGKNLFVSPLPQTPTMIAKFGPAKSTAAAEEYGDLLQQVTIPPGTIALNLTGYYKLTPGKDSVAKPLAKEYVAVGFWEIGGGIEPFAQFHSFEAVDGAQAAWTAFTYDIPKAKVTAMAGNDYTFDLVANLWGSVFQFDTLAVNVTACE